VYYDYDAFVVGDDDGYYDGDDDDDDDGDALEGNLMKKLEDCAMLEFARP